MQFVQQATPHKLEDQKTPVTLLTLKEMCERRIVDLLLETGHCRREVFSDCVNQQLPMIPINLRTSLMEHYFPCLSEFCSRASDKNNKIISAAMADNVIDAYTELLKFDHNFDALMGRANRLYQLGRYDRAISDCNSAHLINPDLQVIVLLGRIYNTIGQYDTTIDTLIYFHEVVRSSVDAKNLYYEAKIALSQPHNILPLENIVESLCQQNNATNTYLPGIGKRIVKIGGGDGIAPPFNWRKCIQVMHLILNGGEAIGRIEILTPLKTDEWTRKDIIKKLFEGVTNEENMVNRVLLAIGENRNEDMEFTNNRHDMQFLGMAWFGAGMGPSEWRLRYRLTNNHNHQQFYANVCSGSVSIEPS